MPRMRAPYTGVVFEVAQDNVERRLARGFALVDQSAPSADDGEAGQPEPVDDGEPCPAAVPDAPKPDETSTIAEIRAWAEARNVELPAKGNKAALLAAIG